MPDLTISLRYINQNDMLDVLNLLQLISKFNPSPSPSQLADNWENFCRQTNVHSLIASVNEETVGYGSVAIVTNIRGGKLGHIEDIVCHSDYQQQGIGRAILSGLFEIAKSKDCYKIALQCKEHNVLFYEKCNYDVSGIAMQRFI